MAPEAWYNDEEGQGEAGPRIEESSLEHIGADGGLVVGVQRRATVPPPRTVKPTLQARHDGRLTRSRCHLLGHSVAHAVL